MRACISPPPFDSLRSLTDRHGQSSRRPSARCSIGAIVRTMSHPLSQRLQARVRRDFRPPHDEDVLGRLASLELPLAEKQSLERIQAAIVLLAAGDVEKLREAAAHAERDWRDVLVWSGLGNGD